ncbi:hypothetical protein [Rubrivirga sp.]|uniref:hypothetical protein n=1 Tax=Rubrivirga sp. TaxID=1885344 RepID=UPI003B51FFE9
MSPLLIPILALLIPIVAILAGTYQKVEKMKAETAAKLGRATDHLDDELADAQAERDRLRRRIEVIEAIVTTEGFDLEREARRAGLTDASGRVDPALLDLDEPEPERQRAGRQRTR